MEGVVSEVNSSISAPFTGDFENVEHFASVRVTIHSDDASITDGVVFLWSNDGLTNHITDHKFTFRLTTENGSSDPSAKAFHSEIRARFFKIQYTPSGFPGVFDLQTTYHYAAAPLPIERIADLGKSKERQAALVKTWPVGLQRSGAAGSITTGGVAQTVDAADTKRRYYYFQNTSDEVMRLRDDGGTASATAGKMIWPGSAYESGAVCPTSAISLYGATTGKTFWYEEG